MYYIYKNCCLESKLQLWYICTVTKTYDFEVKNVQTLFPDPSWTSLNTWPARTSQNFKWPFESTEAISVPELAKLAELSGNWCSANVWWHRPVRASQSFIVLSDDAVSSVVDWPTNSILITALVWPRSVFRHLEDPFTDYFPINSCSDENFNRTYRANL